MDYRSNYMPEGLRKGLVYVGDNPAERLPKENSADISREEDVFHLRSRQSIELKDFTLADLQQYLKAYGWGKAALMILGDFLPDGLRVPPDSIFKCNKVTAGELLRSWARSTILDAGIDGKPLTPKFSLKQRNESNPEAIWRLLSSADVESIVSNLPIRRLAIL